MNLKSICLVKKARLRRPNSVRLHLHDILEKDKAIGTEISSARSWGWRERLTTKVHEGYFFG